MRRFATIVLSVIIAAAPAAAPAFTAGKATTYETWNGGFGWKVPGGRTGFVVPPPDGNPAARIHCSTSGKATT